MPMETQSVRLQGIGNYDLVEKIAEGGMGTVYRGRHRFTGETVAVKVVPQHLLSNPVVLKRFEQEYNVARQISHPNIVKALEFGREGDVRFLVMEFVEGESLGQKIERDGKMQEHEAIRVIALVSQALQKAHKKGMIHRDVKPDNILITKSGEVKLTDLGLVKELEADLNLTRTGRGLGTPHFMAPEQFRNAKKADAKCDIYSLGATLYMMVTGKLPFQSNGPLDAWMKKIKNEIDAPRKVNPEISERLDWAIRRAISPDPAHRPESCREFVEDLTGHATRDVAETASDVDASTEYWYVIYTNTDGTVQTVKGTSKAIRRSLEESRLGDPLKVRVARSKAGPFQAIAQYAEFRDLAIQPSSAVLEKKKSGNRNVESVPQSTPTPVYKASDSQELCTTTILTAKDLAAATSPQPTPKGPCIDLQAESGAWTGEMWKWIALGSVFAAAGIAATFLMPYLRSIRLF
jgi:serine/threonine protein kinase